MVLDLFSGAAISRSGIESSTRASRTPRRADASVSASRSSNARSSRRRTHQLEQHTKSTTVRARTEEDSTLFTNCVSQVQRHLKVYINVPSTLHTLASYYTKVEPLIEGRPFCVSLSYATFLFHLQMARVSLLDVDLYVRLISNVLSQLSDDDLMTHPFVQQVLRDHVFGLPSPTCHGGAHCVVLIPPQQYRGFAVLTTALVAMDVVPLDILYQWQDKLEVYCNAASPIVANRALTLLVQTVTQVRVDEQVTALQYVLKTRPVKMNLDFLLACFERLRRAVVDPANGPTFGRALAIHCSELFLRFRSPIRRDYVEQFLYPSLCHPDMNGFLNIPATRHHLMRELLAQCTPGMSTSSPYYLCLCAVMQASFDNEIDGALETVTLVNCHMPHAAYFMSALAIDSHMSVSMFAKVIIALSRGAGLAMAGREVSDEVAVLISRNRTSVYNVLFLLREVVRSCSITVSRRATDMLKALQVAMPINTIEALGKLSSEAFDGQCDITVDPQLLCAELAMVLHQEHIEEAVDSAVDYFKDVSTQCHFCGMQRSESLLCAVNGTVHVTGQSSVSRVLATLAECAGSKILEGKLIAYLREPATQMDSAVHFLVYYILAHAGQHRTALFVAMEPYIRSTLLAVVSSDRRGPRGLLPSAQKVNVLMLHVKLVTLLASSIDPSYLESILTVFSELKLRNHHDALAMWYMGNLLLRHCKGNVELLPTDPQENAYCVGYPACAPASATCADNAQLVLRLLDRTHRFSAEMRKLVGCCVCKLVQDFNMQAPNIIGTLLSSYGFVPVGLESLNEFALPVGAGSTFWSFFLQQMKTSAPARTAFMTALAKSVSRRFRIASPATAITPSGAETTGQVFAVMMYEAMKRNPPLTRVVMFMISNWMRQPGHPPGKFVCLVYICVQLLTVIVERGEGGAAVELEAETTQDRQQFGESVRKAARLLQGQLTRLEKLTPTLRKDNVEFFHLVWRLQRKARRVVAMSTGAPLPADDVEPPVLARSVVETTMSDREEPTLASEELHNVADDSVFDGYDEAAGRTSVEDGEYPEEVTSYTPEVWSRLSHVSRHDVDHAGTAPRRIHLSEEGEAIMRRDAARHPSKVQPPTVPPLHPIKMPDSATSTHVASSDNLQAHADPTAARDVELVEDEDRGETAVPLAKSKPGAAGNGETSGGVPPPLPESRSRSRGIQTDPEEDAPAPARIAHRGAVVKPTTERPRRVDQGTSVHLPQSVGTSPIQPTGSRGAGYGAPHVHGVRDDDIDVVNHSHGGGERDTGSGTRPSVWHEPDLFEQIQGDTTPIEKTGLPQLQATAGEGVVLPSGMVLEYLRTHQGMDSLQHELLQLDQNWMQQQVVQYAAAEHPSAVQAVTVEGQANNYYHPHDTRDMAPSKTVLAHVRVNQTNPPAASSRTPAHGTRPQWQDDAVAIAGDEDSNDVVDGEHPIKSVSASRAGQDGPAHMSASKRRRMETLAEEERTADAHGYRETGVYTSSAGPRGMAFFMQHNEQNVASTIQDLEHLRRQRRGIENLAAHGQTPTAEPRAMHDSNQQPRETVQRTPALDALAEGLPPTTPYGQVILPACFVEQKNDTAIRELRQVMGTYNSNDSRLSTAGKRRIRGSGAQLAVGEENNDPLNQSSGAWWVEMSAAPMPDYAADPQYSMELF